MKASSTFRRFFLNFKSEPFSVSTLPINPVYFVPPLPAARDIPSTKTEASFSKSDCNSAFSNINSQNDNIIDASVYVPSQILYGKIFYPLKILFFF
ncbi:hypothetical protein AYI68_g6818 [Smittium mucronatum]|uniref:Uncharacterized protein n=1 Tax=Smittium mucronatum TaxID=133383 RepID=A0A1R0GQF2_9FUNG|nr:hypothetical protein AYI68_g6818 [Smittium mucronatum]